MPRRLLLAPALALCALLGSAAPAPAFGPGETFLTGGLDLPPGAIAGGPSGNGLHGADRAPLSADGRYVAFTSQADTLDPAAHPDVYNVYRKDRATGAVVLVSRASGANGATFAAPSGFPRISADGRKVAFWTRAALDPADTDGGAADVYVRDLVDHTTRLATVGSGGQQTLVPAGDFGAFDLSGDGRYVAFATTASLVAGDGNGVGDVYRHTLASGATALVSDDVAGGVRAGNGASGDPAISFDGTWVAFTSSASDLLAVAHGGSGAQLLARDMGAGTTYLVSSRDGSRTAGSRGGASEPDIAGAPSFGRPEQVVIAYTSTATDIAAGDDGNPAASIFRRDLGATNSTLVSRADDGAGGASADSRAHTPSISDDGDVVVFASDADNLGAGDDYYGVYLRHHGLGRTMLASAANEYAVQGSIAGDGDFVAWYETGAVTADADPDLNAVFGRSYAAPASLGAPQLVSRPPGTAPFLATWFAVEGNGESAQRTISADGRYVVFNAWSSRLPGGAGNHVYRRDTLTGAIELVSRADGPSGAPAAGYQTAPSISADGTRVAFGSTAQLDPLHGDGSLQAYVRDLAAGTTTLVSRADGAAGALSDADVSHPRIAAGGGHVAFVSDATNLGAGDGRVHAYVRDVGAGATTLVDRADGAAGAIGNGAVDGLSLSANGRLVAFSSRASNLHPDDPAGILRDVYVRDIATATTILASRRSGLDGEAASGDSFAPSLSADGTTVAFTANDEELAPEAGPWGGQEQVVRRTLATGVNALVSRAPGAGAPADARAGTASVSDDGQVVAFASAAGNLLPGVGGGTRDGVFARTLSTGALSGPPAFGLVDNEPQSRAMDPSLSDDGQCLAFVARGHNAISGLAGDAFTSYVHVVSGQCPKALPVAPLPPRAEPVRAPELRARMTRKRFRAGRRPTRKVAVLSAAARGPAGAAAGARAAARSAARRARRRGGKRTAAQRRAARRKRARQRARRAKVGTAFVVRLSTRANVGVRIERQAQGRLVGRFCRKPRPRLRRNLRCVRFVKVGALQRKGVRAGTSRIAFSGRIGRRALRPGRYRARVRASNAGGTSRWVRIPFRVVRR